MSRKQLRGHYPDCKIYCNCAKPLVWRLPTHATCLACCFLVFLGMSHCSMTTFNLVNFKSQILASAAMSALFTNWLMLLNSPVSSKMWRIEATCNLCIVMCDKMYCLLQISYKFIRWLILYKNYFYRVKCLCLKTCIALVAYFNSWHHRIVKPPASAKLHVVNLGLLEGIQHT